MWNPGLTSSLTITHKGQRREWHRKQTTVTKLGVRGSFQTEATTVRSVVRGCARAGTQGHCSVPWWKSCETGKLRPCSKLVCTTAFQQSQFGWSISPSPQWCFLSHEGWAWAGFFPFTNKWQSCELFLQAFSFHCAQHSTSNPSQHSWRLWKHNGAQNISRCKVFVVVNVDSSNKALKAVH